MANLLPELMELLIDRIIMNAVTSVAGGPPLTSGEVTDAVGVWAVCPIYNPLWLSTHPYFRAVDIPHGDEDEACYWLLDADVLSPTTVNPSKLSTFAQTVVLLEALRTRGP